MRIGAHISRAHGLKKIVDVAVSIRADTFQFFLSSPMNGRSVVLDRDDLECFVDALRRFGLSPIMVHAPYILNLCSHSLDHREFVVKVLNREIEILEKYFPASYYVLHPGNYLGSDAKVGLELCSKLLSEVIRSCKNTTILIETMSGKGTEACSSFSELAWLFSKVNSESLAVCFDTCHVFSAGYDIASSSRSVLSEFDRLIGLNKIKAVHLSDSVFECNSRRDRHAIIGNGKIGKQALIKIIRLLPFETIFCLETPTTNEGHAREIEMIRKVLQNGNNSVY